MTSWRDDASAETQDDLDGLLDEARRFATRMLEEHGEFFPYAVMLDEHGERRIVAGDPGNGERPASTDVITVLVRGTRAQRDVLRTTALVYDVRVSGSDGVRVELEHREGPCMAVVLPYRKKRMRRGVEFGSLAAMSAERRIWA